MPITLDRRPKGTYPSGVFHISLGSTLCIESELKSEVTLGNVPSSVAWHNAFYFHWIVYPIIPDRDSVLSIESLTRLLTSFSRKNWKMWKQQITSYLIKHCSIRILWYPIYLQPRVKSTLFWRFWRTASQQHLKLSEHTDFGW